MIAGYMPLAREADVTPLMERILSCGQALILPRCNADGVMTFRRVTSLDELIPNHWGIPEPPEDAPITLPAAIDLILVPLEAVDPAGYRLGKGGGYYDRYLSMTRALTLGVALSHQQTACVPHDPHDIPLHAAVTPAGVQLFK